MDYGVEMLHQDIQLLQLTNVGAYGSMPQVGRGGVQYYELGTDDKDVWDAWIAALDAAARPYKYVTAASPVPVPVNSPQW